MTSGTRIAIVPHDVPVANEISAAAANTATGSIVSGKPAVCSMWLTYWAVPTACVTAPSDQARTRITMARTIARSPPSQASIASCKARILWPTAKRPATRHPAREPHRSALKELAAPRYSLRVPGRPRLARPPR
jgi:hypothetical protein